MEKEQRRRFRKGAVETRKEKVLNGYIERLEKELKKLKENEIKTAWIYDAILTFSGEFGRQEPFFSEYNLVKDSIAKIVLNWLEGITDPLNQINIIKKYNSIKNNPSIVSKTNLNYACNKWRSLLIKYQKSRRDVIKDVKPVLKKYDAWLKTIPLDLTKSQIKHIEESLFAPIRAIRQDQMEDGRHVFFAGPSFLRKNNPDLPNVAINEIYEWFYNRITHKKKDIKKSSKEFTDTLDKLKKEYEKKSAGLRGNALKEKIDINLYNTTIFDYQLKEVKITRLAMGLTDEERYIEQLKACKKPRDIERLLSRVEGDRRELERTLDETDSLLKRKRTAKEALVRMGKHSKYEFIRNAAIEYYKKLKDADAGEMINIEVKVRLLTEQESLSEKLLQHYEEKLNVIRKEIDYILKTVTVEEVKQELGQEHEGLKKKLEEIYSKKPTVFEEEYADNLNKHYIKVGKYYVVIKKLKEISENKKRNQYAAIIWKRIIAHIRKKEIEELQVLLQFFEKICNREDDLKNVGFDIKKLLSNLNKKDQASVQAAFKEVEEPEVDEQPEKTKKDRIKEMKTELGVWGRSNSEIIRTYKRAFLLVIGEKGVERLIKKGYITRRGLIHDTLATKELSDWLNIPTGVFKYPGNQLIINFAWGGRKSEKLQNHLKKLRDLYNLLTS